MKISQILAKKLLLTMTKIKVGRSQFYLVEKYFCNYLVYFEIIGLVNSQIQLGKNVIICTTWKHFVEMYDTNIYLKPKNLSLYRRCRKGLPMGDH